MRVDDQQSMNRYADVSNDPSTKLTLPDWRMTCEVIYLLASQRSDGRENKTVTRINNICFLTFFLLVLLFSFSLNGQSQQRKLTPQEIIRKMAQVYASCSSYQETGVVETTFDEVTSGRIEKKPFKTYFKRPALFRFEWID